MDFRRFYQGPALPSARSAPPSAAHYLVVLARQQPKHLLARIFTVFWAFPKPRPCTTTMVSAAMIRSLSWPRSRNRFGPWRGTPAPPRRGGPFPAAWSHLTSAVTTEKHSPNFVSSSRRLGDLARQNHRHSAPSFSVNPPQIQPAGVSNQHGNCRRRHIRVKSGPPLGHSLWEIAVATPRGPNSEKLLLLVQQYTVFCR